MGLRTQLKSIIKKALGRSNNTPEPPPYTPPPKPDPVVAPAQPDPIETTETIPQEEAKAEEQPTKEETVESPKVEEQIPEQEEENKEEDSSSEDSSSSSEEEEENKEEKSEDSNAGEESTPAPEGIDTEGAFAVYPIKNLFGESCPNCGASTFNNWAYSDNEFVCQSCDSPL